VIFRWFLSAPSRKSKRVSEGCVLHGRRIEPAELLQARELVQRHPHWSRYRLSRELCALWDWRTATGQWRDMAARTVLLKLEARGWLRLPERRRPSPNRHRLAAPPQRVWDTTPITGSLVDGSGVRIVEVSSRPAERAEMRAALAQFHYLGYRAPVGENLQYLVRNGADRLLGAVVFSCAAWKCAARDRWIGWSRAEREANLSRIANNSRYLLLPWVRVSGLASWILGRLARRIATDWQAKYGHGLALLETFVELARFAGTCYRAANWQSVGVTTGRSRQDRYQTLRVPVKEVYVYPLGENFREALRR
jgi:hypothetical protein